MDGGASDGWQRLPGHLIEVRQLRCLDAMRAYLVGVEQSYARLVDGLSAVGGNGYSTINEAWSTVDSAHRLRSIISHTPGLKKNAPTVAVLVRTLAKAEPFRDALHHAEDKLTQRVSEGTSLLGDLYSYRRRPDGSIGASYFLIGSMAPDPYQVHLPAPSNISAITDKPSFVHLVYGKEVINLSDLANRCKNFAIEMWPEVWRRIGDIAPGSTGRTKLPLFNPDASAQAFVRTRTPRM